MPSKLLRKCLQIGSGYDRNCAVRARCILLVRVRACVLACGVCVRACVFGCMCACARACMRACGFCVLACVRVASASCSCAFVCHLASARRASLRAFVRACEWPVCVHARTQACVCACARACACVRHRRLSRSRQLTKTTGRLCGPDLLPTEEDIRRDKAAAMSNRTACQQHCIVDGIDRSTLVIELNWIELNLLEYDVL